jgi:hypothetical protein
MSRAATRSPRAPCPSPRPCPSNETGLHPPACRQGDASRPARLVCRRQASTRPVQIRPGGASSGSPRTSLLLPSSSQLASRSRRGRPPIISRCWRSLAWPKVWRSAKCGASSRNTTPTPRGSSRTRCHWSFRVEAAAHRSLSAPSVWSLPRRWRTSVWMQISLMGWYASASHRSRLSSVSGGFRRCSTSSAPPRPARRGRSTHWE